MSFLSKISYLLPFVISIRLAHLLQTIEATGERQMKALKKVSLSIVSIATLGTLVLGSYNSMVVNNDAFMTADSGIKFTKRLDEINGKVTIGRMAASSTPWTNFHKKAEKLVKKAEKKIAKKKFKKAEKMLKKAVEKVASTSSKPAPAINADLDLKLNNVFFKKPLAQGSFTGSAKTVDGVIEEIYVSMPNGSTIEINTQERMTGNVFQYEDSQTREMKSGMFYEVKKGTYMITLTNDSQFPGARFEFKADNAEVAYNNDHYSAQESWDMDQQNQNNELANEQQYNQEPVDNYNNDVDYAQNYENEGQQGYGFNFQS